MTAAWPGQAERVDVPHTEERATSSGNPLRPEPPRPTPQRLLGRRPARRRPAREDSWTGTLRSTRARMVLTYLLLSIIASFGAAFAIREVLVHRLEYRTEQALRQELAEVENLLEDGRDPETGEPFDRLERFFDVFLQRNVPAAEEAFIGLIDGEIYLTSLERYPPVDPIDDAMREWVELGASTLDVDGEMHGTTETELGTAWYSAVPVEIGDQSGAFVVTILPEHEHSSIRTLQTYGMEIIAFVVLASAACAWLLSGRILAPVRALTETARSISASDLGHRIPERGSDEAARMARTFNQMLDRVESAHRSQVEFLRAAGHELRTPITVASGHLQVMRDEDDDRRVTLPLVLDELRRMGGIVRDIESLTAAEMPDFLHPRDLDLALFTHQLVAKAEALGDRRWVVDAVGDATFVGDRHRLTEAVLNLATNAVAHTATGEEIGVGSAVRGESVVLWVRDTGVGVAPEDRERIFERFVRGTAASSRYRGAGLGLALVRAIARAHGGEVALEPTDGRGSTFTLVLPMAGP